MDYQNLMTKFKQSSPLVQLGIVVFAAAIVAFVILLILWLSGVDFSGKEYFDIIMSTPEEKEEKEPSVDEKKRMEEEEKKKQVDEYLKNMAEYEQKYKAELEKAEMEKVKMEVEAGQASQV